MAEDGTAPLRDWSIARGAERLVHFDGAVLRVSASNAVVAIWDSRFEVFRPAVDAASGLDPARVIAVLEQAAGLRDPVAVTALLDAHLASVRRPS